MANTYYLLASSTVPSSGASSITFTGIPSGYTDLKLCYSTRITASANWLEPNIGFNGYTGISTSGNYAKYLFATNAGTGTATSSVDAYGGESVGSTATAGVFSSAEIYIPNYLSTSANKPCWIDAVTENNAAAAATTMWAINMLGNAAAITSLTLTANSTFVQYSTAYLYGIKSS